mgnify:CR=1 FL=1
MPELPEVETVLRTLETKIKDKKILDIAVLYAPIVEGDVTEFKNKLIGQHFRDFKRRGKYLLFEMDDITLVSHLRMEGKYVYRNLNQEIEKHELVIFNIDDRFELRYKDVRRFGKMYLVEKDNLCKSPLSKLGYEPWDDALTVDYLREKYKNKSIPIKTILLDQTIVTGIGNIYADEILFLSKINPKMRGRDLTDENLNDIIINTRKVLEQAIEQKGTTIRSYTSEEGVAGNFQNNLSVHKREGEKCLCCNGIIKRIKIGGRSTYYCENCQK